jgi:zinc-ribbon domain
MYNSKLVASIKANNRVLKEFKDTVYIPFASEYSILIKNLNTVRAVVNVFIDGENVVPGGLVIDPGRDVDLERWIKNGNLSEGNRFKFIERTTAIEEGPRGIGLEDGLIRIEYQFEKPYVPPQWSNTSWISASGSTTPMYNVNGVMRGVDFSKGEAMKASATSAMNSTLQSMNISSMNEYHEGTATMDWHNDVGITVPGSKSTQTFQTTTVGALETQVHNIVLKLVGDLGHNKPVTKPVTVQHKPKCVTCGKQNRAHAKFCVECGTALEIFA